MQSVFKWTTGHSVGRELDWIGMGKDGGRQRLQPCSCQGVALYSSEIWDLTESFKEESNIFRFMLSEYSGKKREGIQCWQDW